MEQRGVEQDLIPYMGPIELAKAPIEEWIIDTDVHGLLEGLCDVLHLPTYYEEVVYPCVMICGVGMAIDG